MKKPSILFFLLPVAMVGCHSKPKQPLAELSSRDLFEKFRKNVVLIKSKSHYKVTFSNQKQAWFSGFNDDENVDLTFSEAEAIEQAETGYGTGFFISQKGLIATNFHVVCGGVNATIEKTDFKQAVITSLQLMDEQARETASMDVAKLKRYHPEDSLFIRDSVPGRYIDGTHEGSLAMDNYTSHETDSSSSILKYHIDSLLAANSTIESLFQQDFKIEIVNDELSIQLDASTKNSDVFPCHLYSLSQDKKIDLALIQTNDKMLPVGVGDVTDLLKENDDEHYGSTLQDNDTLKVTTPLYLIGYNYGPDIAKTAQGIKVQLGQGEVTQESDQYRVLYSIPTLPGSSGSPVFNNKGKIVAINFSGYLIKENFNYGVLSSNLKDMVDKRPVLSVPL